MMYTLRAWWPNSQMDPDVKYLAHFADALDWALAWMRTHKYTTIQVVTPDSLELIRLWGQPPAKAEEWI